MDKQSCVEYAGGGGKHGSALNTQKLSGKKSYPVTRFEYLPLIGSETLIESSPYPTIRKA